MKVSLIIAVYKDYCALNLILKQLSVQTYKNFEVVITEDAVSDEVINVIKKHSSLDIVHLSQEDDGIRKMRAQNRAIMASSGEYLIFIDGDCIPYHNFIEAHVYSSVKGEVASGRRVNLGPDYSRKFRDSLISPESVSRNYIKHFLPILIDGKEGHAESGFSFPAGGIVERYVLRKMKRTTSILGCNFSCFKKDIVSINGFDESYGETAIGDDTDIEWRFISYGLRLKSVKNIANVFHLYHEKRNRTFENLDALLTVMHCRREAGEYTSKKGLAQL
ncbi:glycosyltransferase [Enterovibrio calviensis]|uniref:glycosyltransferase n=1 Tax=Enterovibrio calviensis TaxID=91359 RepID=UPI00068862B8|nr:glycosyltransferase [Enterovibrio calviensis]